MSKFFKALEQAERERAHQQATAPVHDEPAVSQQTEAAVEETEQTTPGVEIAKDVRRRTTRSLPGEERTSARAQPPGRLEPPVRTKTAARLNDASRAEPSAPKEGAEGADWREEPGPEYPSESRVEIDKHLVSLIAPVSFAADEYRRLRLVIEQRTGLQVVAVTSGDGGDGKTTTAINLAGALAQSLSSRVLLVDADLRHPSMASCLGLDPSRGRGLVDLVQDPSLSLERLVHRLSVFNLSVLPAGRPVSNEYEVLQSPRLAAVLKAARERYDFIVLDVPPLPPVPDCRAIANCVDGFIVVVAAHRTTRQLLDETLGMLEPGKVVGLVFNRSDDRPGGGYYYSYRSKTSQATSPSARASVLHPSEGGPVVSGPATRWQARHWRPKWIQRLK